MACVHQWCELVNVDLVDLGASVDEQADNASPACPGCGNEGRLARPGTRIDIGPCAIFQQQVYDQVG
jgi:hypothetical protein